MMARRSQAKSQLCLNNRIKINTGIILGMSAITIAKQLKVSRQTIYREIKRNRKMVKRRTSSNKSVFYKHRNDCPYKATMRHQGFTVCFEKCEHFEDDICDGLLKFPFCCNTCSKKTYCIKQKYYYDVKHSEEQTIQRRSDVRKGIRISRDDFSYIDSIVSEGLRKGQSLEHILRNHKEIKVSAVTIRRWINAGFMIARDIDLPRKVRFKVSKDYVPRVVKNPELMVGRTYDDLKKWCEQHSRHAIQIDTVHGKMTDNKCLLTIFIPEIRFQFGRLLDSCSPEAVNAEFYGLRQLLGNELFKKIFPAILCDNGIENLKLPEIEFDPMTGEQLTKVFYCDPYRSSQKGACERNHELIRYIKAKGKTLDDLTQDDADLMFSHINSLSRKSLMGKTPYELAVMFFGHEFVNLINIKKIDPDKVHLRHDLFSMER